MVSRASFNEVQNLTNNWLFEWRKEMARLPVYKLVTVEQKEVIHGLMSVEENKGFLFVTLIETPRTTGAKTRNSEAFPAICSHLPANCPTTVDIAVMWLSMRKLP
jgi:hypothetical protein